MEKIGKVEDRHEKLTLPMSTPKTLRFIEEESNLKSALVNKRKEIGSTHAFFRPRSNFKPKKNVEFFAQWRSKHISSCHYPSQFDRLANLDQ